MIGILAAYGFTGSLITRELCGSGRQVRIIGRRRDALEKLANEFDPRPAVVQADVANPVSLSEALSGLNVLINCAGPFTDLGEPVVREAAARGIHYLDTTGEQGFIRLALEKYGPIAAVNGSTVIPACAFEYAIGDAACAMAAESVADCDSLEITYILTGFGSSRGTKKSILRVLGTTGYARSNGEAKEIGDGALTKKFNIPGRGSVTARAFPGGEAFMTPLQVPARNITTWMVMPGPGAVIALANKALPAIMRSWIGTAILNRIDKSQFGPDDKQRAKTEFTIVCNATGKLGEKQVVVTGRDPYGLTAKIAALVSGAIEDKKLENVGAVSPSMVSGYKAIVDCTEAAGVNWNIP